MSSNYNESKGIGLPLFTLGWEKSEMGLEKDIKGPSILPLKSSSPWWSFYYYA